MLHDRRDISYLQLGASAFRHLTVTVLLGEAERNGDIRGRCGLPVLIF